MLGSLRTAGKVENDVLVWLCFSSALPPGLAEGGICAPDTWAAGVVINAMLPRRRCFQAQQKENKKTNGKR